MFEGQAARFSSDQAVSIQLALLAKQTYRLEVTLQMDCQGQPAELPELAVLWDQQALGVIAINTCDSVIQQFEIGPDAITGKVQTLTVQPNRSASSPSSLAWVLMHGLLWSLVK